ncbi:hypothetical protein Ccrd_023458, partial [Cynara cardunculus var. scolymus]
MQGQRGAIGSFPETLGFDHGSGSSDGDQQICWENNLQNSPSNRLSDYMSSANGSDLFLESTNQEGQGISMWTVGEAGSSSGTNQVSHGQIEPRPDRGWPALMKSCPEPSARMLQLGDHGSSVPHNVPLTSLETFSGSATASSSSFSDPFGPSSDPFEMDDRRLSRKRKAVELSVGQSSSGIGSSNTLERPEGGSTMWQTIAENPPSDNQIIPRLGLGVSGLPFENPVAENTRRNVQLRISSSRQQDPLLANSSNRQSDISALYPSLRLNPVDFRSLPVPATAENSNSSSHQGQPVLRIPALRRNFQSSSRWSRSSSSRNNRSSNLVIPERNEVDSRAIPSNISDHPLFAQPTEINWSANGGGGTISNAGNGIAATSSQAAPTPLSAAPNSSAHRNQSHYNPRRLSAFLRRSLLSATDSEAAGGLNSNIFPRIPPSASSSQDLGIPSAVSIQGHHQQQQPHLRTSSVLVGRQLEGAFGFPYLSRSMMAGSEGRGRLVSEIRNVLDLMRRGEPLRFEELLALEERIGNVNTGLTEDAISKHLKQKQYVTVTGQPDAEPCCVCQIRRDCRIEMSFKMVTRNTRTGTILERWSVGMSSITVASNNGCNTRTRARFASRRASVRREGAMENG